jgi:hypothetical protein
VGPFAIEEGLVRATDPMTAVRIWQTNTRRDPQNGFALVPASVWPAAHQHHVAQHNSNLGRAIGSTTPIDHGDFVRSKELCAGGPWLFATQVDTILYDEEKLKMVEGVRHASTPEGFGPGCPPRGQDAYSCLKGLLHQGLG